MVMIHGFESVVDRYQAVRTPSTSPVKPAKAEVFYFHEFLDAVVGTFTTKPRLFHATKRRNFVRDQARIDAHHAAFKALGRPPDPADIAAIEVARESKFGIVGHFDRLLIGLE